MKQSAPRISLVRMLLIGGGILFLLILLLPRGGGGPELELSTILQMADEGQIAKIQVRGDKLNVLSTNGEEFTSRKESGVSILELLDQRGISTDEGGIPGYLRSILSGYEGNQ